MKRLNSEIKQIILILIFGILISSCSPIEINQETIGTQPTGTQEKIPTPTVLKPNDQQPIPTKTPSLIETGAFEGPLLLLQTGVDSFHILDLATYRLTPYELPGIIKDQKLSSNLSPDGKHLLIFTSDQSFEIVNILSKGTAFSYNFSQDNLGLELDQAVESALQVFPGYTIDFMQDLIEQTIAQGKQDIQWYQNGQTLIILKVGSAISTNLALLDLSTGESNLLEQNPRLVENYWLGPGDEKLLLKKGFSIAPNDWQDDQYLLLDTITGDSIEINLPLNSENPSIYWFSDDLIGVIHQTGIVSGTDFSLIRIPEMVSNQVITGSFSSLFKFGSDILTLYQNRERQTTNLTLKSINGDLLTSQEIAGICSVKRKITNLSLLLNCETGSYLVEGQKLTITDFGDPIFLISRSPDRQYYVLITKEKDNHLLTSDLQQKSSIQLQGEPLEILWLPDSSGFLYRTARELIHYDITGRTNNFILSSDLFGDYRNLNAVWVTLD